ncbi:MAG: hypothetical protein A3I66_07165 [Burkholderiales bacterium RIFCSPLOWO2_02_FULL_57_36]|nr:MAG: hypothetical protein A3I66_07165 [Burkholderiales bacterium RIFCSPLOWO2_02_FULL_57_36]
MSTLFTQNSHTVEHGQVLSGIARHAKTLHVASGLVWITIEGLPEDHWLCGGDMLLIPPDRLVVIEAEKCISLVDIRPTAMRRARNNPRARIGKGRRLEPSPCSLE